MLIYLVAIILSGFAIQFAGSPGLADPQLAASVLLCVPVLVAIVGWWSLGGGEFQRRHWVWVGLVVSRSISAGAAWFASPFMLPFSLAPIAGLMTQQVARFRQDRIRPALQQIGLILTGISLFQLLAPGMQNVWLNRNALASALCLSLAAYLPDLVGSGRLSKLLAALVTLGIVATGSRGGLIAAALMAAYHFRLLHWAAPAAVAAVPIALQLRNPAAISIRLGFWRDALASWMSSPLIGIGPQPLPGGALHAHNLPLGVLAWSGLIGLVILGYGIGRSAKGWYMPRWAWAGVVAFLAHGMIEDFTIQPAIMALLGVILASEPKPGQYCRHGPGQIQDTGHH